MPDKPSPSATTSDSRARGGARTLTDYFDTLMQRGAWVPGVKLPSERELSARFGATRGAVRKVIDSFVERGVLRRAAGSGTYVAMVPTTDAHQGMLQSATAHISPTELMEARLLFEPLMPDLIVRHASPHDFARMSDCLARGEQATTAAEFELWDGKLHKIMAQATHNTLMEVVLELMTSVREAGEWGRLKQQALTPQRRRCYEAQHRAIVAALRERDAPLASELMRAHLNEARSNLFNQP